MNCYHLKYEGPSLPQASHTVTWSIISHNEPDKMAEEYIRIQTSIQNQIINWMDDQNNSIYFDKTCIHLFSSLLQ